jgi:hypothetical protein
VVVERAGALVSLIAQAALGQPLRYPTDWAVMALTSSLRLIKSGPPADGSVQRTIALQDNPETVTHYPVHGIGGDSGGEPMSMLQLRHAAQREAAKFKQPLAGSMQGTWEWHASSSRFGDWSCTARIGSIPMPSEMS